MSRRPEEVIRRYLDEHGDLDAVAVDHLLVSWRFDKLTPHARVTIDDALASVGVHVDPPLAQAHRRGTVVLSLAPPKVERSTPPWELASAPAPPPEPAEPASPRSSRRPRAPRRPTLRGPRLPRPPKLPRQRTQPRPEPPPRPEPEAPPARPAPPAPPARPEPEPAPRAEPERAPSAADRDAAAGPFAFLTRFARPRALIAGGGLAAFVALWIPWVEWSSPAVVTLDFERTGDAWRALGAEPWAIFLALVFGLAFCAARGGLPERWRGLYAGVTSTLALALGALGVLVSAINILAPADSAFYTRTELRGGPFLALAGSIALVAGVWLARPDAEGDAASSFARTAPGSEST